MKPAFAVNPQAWVHRAAPSPQERQERWDAEIQDTLPQRAWPPVARAARGPASSRPRPVASTEAHSLQPSRFKLVMTVSAALLAVLGLGLSVGAWVAKSVLGVG